MGSGSVEGPKVSLKDGRSYNCDEYTLGWGLDSKCVPMSVYMVRKPGDGSFADVAKAVSNAAKSFMSACEVNKFGTLFGLK